MRKYYGGVGGIKVWLVKGAEGEFYQLGLLRVVASPEVEVNLGEVRVFTGHQDKETRPEDQGPHPVQSYVWQQR